MYALSRQLITQVFSHQAQKAGRLLSAFDDSFSFICTIKAQKYYRF
jgi:hypothetical protein